MKKLLIILCGVFLVFAITASAGAYISIVDDDNYWPTWYNSTDDDALDVIGGPSVTELRVYLAGMGYLDKIEILMADPSLPGYSLSYHPTALFIDNYGGDNIWDWYVETSSNTSASLYYVTGLGISSENPSPGSWPSTQYKNSSWSGGGNYRQNHPAGIANLGSALTDGLDSYGYSDGILSFNFEDSLIDFSIYPWVIGYTEVCANDVIIGGGAPVPEPATMLLLGTGLLGLAGIGRKKFFKKS